MLQTTCRWILDEEEAGVMFLQTYVILLSHVAYVTDIYRYLTSQKAFLCWSCASSHFFTMGRDYDGRDILCDTR